MPVAEAAQDYRQYTDEAEAAQDYRQYTDEAEAAQDYRQYTDEAEAAQDYRQYTDEAEDDDPCEYQTTGVDWQPRSLVQVAICTGVTGLASH